MRSLRYIGNPEPFRSVETGVRILLALALLAVLAAGCGSEAAEEPRQPAPPPQGLLLEVERTLTLPVAVYADGRFFTAAPQIAIYPAPALPAFNVARIPPEQARRIVDRVQVSGALDRNARAPVAVATEILGDERRVTQLGEEDAATVEAILADLPVSSSDSLYEPQALAVIAAAPEPSYEEPDARDWPLGDLPPGCSVVRGADLDTVLPAAAQATQLTRWRIAGGLMVGVTFRPLLPHEGSCDDVAGPSA